MSAQETDIARQSHAVRRNSAAILYILIFVGRCSAYLATASCGRSHPTEVRVPVRPIRILDPVKSETKTGRTVAGSEKARPPM